MYLVALPEFEQSLVDRLQSEDGVSQEELLALAAQNKEAAVDLDLVEPSTSFQSSSRRGGARQLEDESDNESEEPRPSTSGTTSKGEGECRLNPERLEIDLNRDRDTAIEIDMGVVAKAAFSEESDIFADVFAPKTGAVRNASSSSSSSTSEFKSSDDDDDGGKDEDSNNSKDLFADVFSSKEEVSKLEKLLKKGETSGEQVVNKDRNRVLGAAATADSVEELFANVTSKSRKFEDSGEPDASTARRKTKENDIASTMKGSSHLFLKIKSKWVEGAEAQGEESETNRTPKETSSKDGEDDMSKMLEQENKALVR